MSAAHEVWLSYSHASQEIRHAAVVIVQTFIKNLTASLNQKRKTQELSHVSMQSVLNHIKDLRVILRQMKSIDAMILQQIDFRDILKLVARIRKLRIQLQTASVVFFESLVNEHRTLLVKLEDLRVRGFHVRI